MLDDVLSPDSPEAPDLSGWVWIGRHHTRLQIRASRQSGLAALEALAPFLEEANFSGPLSGPEFRAARSWITFQFPLRCRYRPFREHFVDALLRHIAHMVLHSAVFEGMKTDGD